MKIAIIGAMDSEVEIYLKRFNVKKYNDKEIYTTLDNNIIIARCGIGKVNSAMITQYIIDIFKPDLVINSGCAGALSKDLNVLDVVIPDYITYHDFLPERIMQYSTPNNGKLKCDEKTSSLFKEIIDEMEDISYVCCPICSGDCYVEEDKTAIEIIKRTGAYVVDMESASIAHVCSFNSVPYVIIRTISDFANGDDSFEAKAAYHSSNIICECVRKLKEM